MFLEAIFGADQNKRVVIDADHYEFFETPTMDEAGFVRLARERRKQFKVQSGPIVANFMFADYTVDRMDYSECNFAYFPESNRLEVDEELSQKSRGHPSMRFSKSKGYRGAVYQFSINNYDSFTLSEDGKTVYYHLIDPLIVTSR